MSEPFIAEIRMLPYTYAPRDWASCDGQLIDIEQNTALFSLIGTTFGGDGRNTMGLPNLQGRSVLSSGKGPGLTPYLRGEVGGFDTVALNEYQLPAHTHQASGNRAPGTTQDPSAQVLYGGENALVYSTYKQSPSSKVAMSESALSNAGFGFGHENRQPFLCVQFCICLNGVYPQRS